MAIAPNNQKLVITGKNNQDAHQGYATDARTIEQWANEGIVRKLIAGSNITLSPSSGIDEGGGITINATGGGGFVPYASLLGPGETVTPGALTQTGGFHVTDASTFNIVFNQTNAAGLIQFNATHRWEVNAHNAQINAVQSAAMGAGTWVQLSMFSLAGTGLIWTTDDVTAGFPQDMAFFTAAITGKLVTPIGFISPNRAFGFTGDGHISFFNGTSWSVIV